MTTSAMPPAGESAPDFTGTTGRGDTVRLSDHRGRWVLLYFYPKDDTPGCTSEACDFRDNVARLGELGYEVYGVSPDSVKSHDKFRDKYDLNFPLLADPDHAAAEAFGVWREKKNYGKTYTGIVRSTFLVGEDGTLEQIYDNVRAKGHVDRVLRDLQA